jgi:hypothetical protein
MISRCLGSSRKFAALRGEGGRLGEFAQALYPLVVANADDFGRESGDAFTVKHAVWPTSPRPEADFEAALVAMHAVDLIRRYEVEGQIVLEVVAWEAHQDLHKKAQNSKFPENPGKLRETPPQSKRRELKRREVRTTYPAKEPPDPRVKVFLTWFQSEYKARRHGSTYFVNWKKDAAIVKRLLCAYDLERLKTLATILLLCDDPWVAGTDRSVGILATKINWLEDWERTWTAKHQQSAS